MADMLVNLLKIEPFEPLVQRLRGEGVSVRRANPWELSRVRDFATKWGENWSNEVTIGFSRQPISIFIAAVDGEVAGFCAYECSCRNYLGPIGVDEQFRGRDIGKALLLCGLHALREMGYAYAIIGGVGPCEFYTKCCGATLIENSGRGIYVDMLKKR